MKTYDYLTTVVETVASIGHRDNRDFQRAFSTAATALRNATPEAVLLPVATECRDFIRDGLKTYAPGHRWFDATAAVEYATLVAKFNSVA